MLKKTTALVALLSVFGAAASASVFDIVFELPEAPSDSQQALLDAAETFWEGAIVGYQSGIAVDALTIQVGAFDIDGPGGTLAEASPTDAVNQGGFIVPTEGFVDFDVNDLDSLEESDLLFSVLLHEVAHVMGLGTLWEANGVYVDDSGEYLGASGLAAYQEEFDPLAAFVPVELDFGPGTANAHWDENWAGGSAALMTGIFEGPTFTSNTTIASFTDLGYLVAGVAPIPLPAGIWLGLSGLAAFGVAGRLTRRRRI